MTFSKLIKARRMEQGLTQGEVAEKANTTQAAVSKIERYGLEPKFELACAILEALNLSADDAYEVIRTT